MTMSISLVILGVEYIAIAIEPVIMYLIPAFSSREATSFIRSSSSVMLVLYSQILNFGFIVKQFNVHSNHRSISRFHRPKSKIHHDKNIPFELISELIFAILLILCLR